MLSLLPTTNAGLTIGGASSTDKCYDALQESAGDDNLVDKEEYTTFVNIMSDYAFTYPQYNEESGAWENLPVSEFSQLPIGLQMNFNKLACGGPFISCSEAYLYTDGSGNGESPNDQEIVYLYDVCSGTEEATDVALAEQNATGAPTAKPTEGEVVPSASPVVVTTLPMRLSYQMTVAESVTAVLLMDPNNGMRDDLIAGMSTWMDGTVEGMNDNSGGGDGGGGTAAPQARGGDLFGKRMLRGGSGSSEFDGVRRRLLVGVAESTVTISNVTDVGTCLCIFHVVQLLILPTL